MNVAPRRWIRYSRGHSDPPKRSGDAATACAAAAARTIRRNDPAMP